MALLQLYKIKLVNVGDSPSEFDRANITNIHNTLSYDESHYVF